MPEPTDAPSAAFPDAFLTMSDNLKVRFPHDTADVHQDMEDVEAAYSQATALQDVFLTQLQILGGQVGESAISRPNGLKNQARAFEKAQLYGLVPLDLLAGKLVFTSLDALYQAAGEVDQVFQVRAFRDRFRYPRASGYRDVQFIVEVDGHLAEVKFCHRSFDELDRYEHTLYGMRRALEAQDPLTDIEELVLATLNDASTLMFQKVWALVSAEGGEA